MKLQSTLKAWVARDEDGSLYLYLYKPEKLSDYWNTTEVGFMKLDDSLFPEVKWEDEEPKEIKLSIMENSKIKSALSSLCRIAVFIFVLWCTVLGMLHVIQWIIWHTFRT